MAVTSAAMTIALGNDTWWPPATDATTDAALRWSTRTPQSVMA